MIRPSVLRVDCLHPTSQRAQRYFFPLEDVQRIVRAAAEPHKTFYGLLAETGLRVGELCGLTVDDVNLERGLLVVRQSAWRGKLVGPKTTNGVRVINLSPLCVEHLRAFLKTWHPNDNRLLFATGNAVGSKHATQAPIPVAAQSPEHSNSQGKRISCVPACKRRLNGSA
jgi:integrase